MTSTDHSGESHAPPAAPGTAAWKIGPFFVIIFVPLIFMIFAPSESAEESENRRLAAFPAVPSTMESLFEWPGSFGAYVGDHFGFRLPLIRLASHARQELNGGSGSSVLRGKDDWMFYATNKRHDTIRQYRGVDRFTPDELDEAARRLEGWQSWFEERDIPFLFVVAPNKVTVYPDYLPDHLAKPLGPSMNRVLIDHLREHTSVRILDLGDTLRKARQETEFPLYLRTDTHWNGRGAFAGYQELTRVLEPLVPGLRRYEPSDYQIVEREATGGDLARMLTIADSETDLDFGFVLNAAPEIETRLESGETRSWGSLYRTFNRSFPEGPRLLCFHDSFFLAIEPFLAASVGEIAGEWAFRLDPDHYYLDADLIERENPDFVVLEMLERHLYYLPKLPLPGETVAKSTTPDERDQNP